MSKPESLPVALRVFPVAVTEQKTNKKIGSQSLGKWRRPNAMFVFDTETSTDACQRLKIGSYRFIVHGECVEEGIFHADDLAEDEMRILHKYASTRDADTTHTVKTKIRLMNRTEFAERLFRAGYKSRSLIVGFNLPFDLSRIAFDAANARGRFAGGFSLGLCSYTKDLSGNN